MKYALSAAALCACLAIFIFCVSQGTAEEAVISYEELAERLREPPAGFILIDVRTVEEYAAGHIPRAVNIPVALIGDEPPAAERDALIVVYCRSGNRSRTARNILVEKGFTQVVDFGGINRWRGVLVEGDKPE